MTSGPTRHLFYSLPLINGSSGVFLRGASSKLRRAFSCAKDPKKTFRPSSRSLNATNAQQAAKRHQLALKSHDVIWLVAGAYASTNRKEDVLHSVVPRASAHSLSERLVRGRGSQKISNDNEILHTREPTRANTFGQASSDTTTAIQQREISFRRRDVGRHVSFGTAGCDDGEGTFHT